MDDHIFGRHILIPDLHIHNYLICVPDIKIQKIKNRSQLMWCMKNLLKNKSYKTKKNKQKTGPKTEEQPKTKTHSLSYML